MKLYYFIVLLFLGCLNLSAQDYISKLSFKQQGNSIVVDYHLTEITKEQYYKVQIKVESQIKGVLDVYEFSGNIGKVENGGSKRIWWNVLGDISKLKGGIDIRLSATLYEKEQITSSIVPALKEGYSEAKKYYKNKEYKKAKPIFERLANDGNDDAQFYLGWMYEMGEGVTKSESEAVKWYRKSAEQGEAAAQNNLGSMYREGRGVKQSDEEAVKWYRKSAKQGRASGQCNLGWMYKEGRGVKQSDEEAVRWYRKSAERGWASGQCNLGWMYEVGRGVEKSKTTAIKWYQKSAEQGNATAQCNLGWMYANGIGVTESESEGVKWYRKAAKQGHERAKKKLKELGYEP